MTENRILVLVITCSQFLDFSYSSVQNANILVIDLVTVIVLVTVRSNECFTCTLYHHDILVPT